MQIVIEIRESKQYRSRCGAGIIRGTRYRDDFHNRSLGNGCIISRLIQ